MPSVPDILDDLAFLILRAEQSVESRTCDDLVGNDETYNALTYRLAMIGETCKKLPDAIKARHPHLPWREMATFRDVASHDYFGVDVRLLWQPRKALGRLKP